MWIVLTAFGTQGDVHSLIAIALKMRRRGHQPVLAGPEIFRAKIEPLDLSLRRLAQAQSDDPTHVNLRQVLQSIRGWFPPCYGKERWDFGDGCIAAAMSP